MTQTNLPPANPGRFNWKEAIAKHDLKVGEVKTDIFNIEKLLLGRIDIFVTDHEVMQRTIEQNPKYQGKLKWNENPVFESVNNLGISKKSFLTAHLPEIDKVLEEMKADGTFDKIFCAYDKVYRAGCKND